MRRLVSTIDLPKTDWLKYRKKVLQERMRELFVD